MEKKHLLPVALWVLVGNGCQAPPAMNGAISTPAITKLTPSSGPTVGQTPIVITGTGFIPGATVTVGGQGLDGTLVVSSMEIIGTVPDRPGLVGDAHVIVTNPDGGAADATYTYSYDGVLLDYVTVHPFMRPPRSVAVGDFNSDGKLDLAVLFGYGTSVSILLGDGVGGFGTTAASFPATADPNGYPSAIAVGDFNRDGKPDLAIANSGDVNFHDGGNVSVLLGDGMGTFGPAAYFAAGVYPDSVAAGDFNSDGKLDLAVANSGSSDVSVLLGNGVGGFGAPTSYIAGGRAVAVGDFNGDGKPDLAIAGSGVAVLLNDGLGGFGASAYIAVEANPNSLAVGDFNGDGKLDVACTNSNGVSVLPGVGQGSLHNPIRVGDAALYGQVVAADFNGDGKPDLAVNATDINVLLGDGQGAFRAVGFSAGGSPISMAVGDFNGDGEPDLAVANAGSKLVSVLLNNSR